MLSRGAPFLPRSERKKNEEEKKREKKEEKEKEGENRLQGGFM